MNKLLISLLAGVVCALPFTAAADNHFPEKPVRLVVPFGAGGGTDSLARAMQAAIEEHDLMSQPLVVNNATGAGGAVGSRQVLSAEPDGHTILQIHQEMFAAAAIGRVNYTPLDFEPVIQISEACMFVAVPADSPFDTLEEMLDFARENPGRFKQADDIGGATHFPSVRLMNVADAEWPIVPTGATSARFASLEGGFTQMAFMSPGWIERAEGKLKPLAVLGNQRYDFAPDIPTAKELGYDVTSCLSRRIWAPGGTPQDVVEILADTFEAAANTDDVRGYLERVGETHSIVRGDELRSAVETEFENFMSVAEAVKGAAADN